MFNNFVRVFGPMLEKLAMAAALGAATAIARALARKRRKPSHPRSGQHEAGGERNEMERRKPGSTL